MAFIVHDKLWLGQVLYMSDATLHGLVGLVLFALFLKVAKSPSRAFLGVFAIELANEINDTIVAYPDLSSAFWLNTSTDILATMALPCLTAYWMVFRHRSSMGRG